MLSHDKQSLCEEFTGNSFILVFSIGLKSQKSNKNILKVLNKYVWSEVFEWLFCKFLKEE